MRLKIGQDTAFLLTPLREGRHADGDDFTQTPLISTHAPAGGATNHQPPRRHTPPDFYSRPCGRGDAATPHVTGWIFRFLLTPLREGRRIAAPESVVSVGFLLTPLREGRLGQEPLIVRRMMISTHAPAGGATMEIMRGVPRRTDFYSRPCGRGDPAADVRGLAAADISTHAPAGGATKISTRAPLHTNGNFYSRPCGRGDFSS